MASSFGQKGPHGGPRGSTGVHGGPRLERKQSNHWGDGGEGKGSKDKGRPEGGPQGVHEMGVEQGCVISVAVRIPRPRLIGARLL